MSNKEKANESNFFTKLVTEFQLSLVRYFKNKSTQNYETSEANCRKIIEEYTSTVSLNQAGLILKAIFFPYMCLVIDEENSTLALAMISLINWWITNKPSSAPDKQLVEAIVKRKCYRADKLDIKSCIENKSQLIISSQSSNEELAYLVNHLSFNNGSSSFDCDNLISLINYLIHYEDCRFKNLLCSCNFKPIWNLFFNPLTIKSVCTSDGHILEDLLKSKIAKIPVDQPGSTIDVIWSDNRKSENRSNYQRRNINFVIHEYVLSLKGDDLKKVISEIDWEQISDWHEFKDFIVEQLDALRFVNEEENYLAIKSLLESIKKYASFLLTETELVLLTLKRFSSPAHMNDFVSNLIDYSILQIDDNLKIKILEYLHEQLVAFEDKEYVASLIKMYYSVLKSFKEYDTKMKASDFTWLGNVIIKNNFDEIEEFKKVAKILSSLIEHDSILLMFLSNYLETKRNEFLDLFSVSLCQQSENILAKSLNYENINILKDTIQLMTELQDSTVYRSTLSFIIQLVDDNVGSSENKFVENSDFIMTLVSLMNQENEFNLKIQLIRLILRISVRIKDWKVLNRNIAAALMENLREILNGGLKFDVLEMILCFLGEIDRQTDNGGLFIDDFTKILIHEATLSPKSNGIKETFSAFCHYYIKSLNNLKNDSNLKDLVQKRVSEIIKLMKDSNYQESIAKILLTFIDTNKKEKEFMLLRFGSSDFEDDKPKKEETAKSSLFFNCEFFFSVN